jgi:hypothetical protein
MIVTFYDRQDPADRLNSSTFDDGDLLVGALHDRQNRRPFFCELDGENGYKLMIGLGNPWSCVQFSKANGELPYLMALGEDAGRDGPNLEYLINDTATPVPFRFALATETLWKIVRFFLETGGRSQSVHWEEI